MRVAFRTDASDAIGSGHVVRCLTLADRLAADGHQCTFLMRRHPGHMIGTVAARGHDVLDLGEPDGSSDADLDHSAWLGTSQAGDAAVSRAALDDPVDWLVVDHYGLDHRWQSAMRPMAARILVIDDIADRRHDADVLVDQNLQASENRYDGLLDDRCTRLIGPAFAMLRPTFAALRAAPGPANPKPRVLVYFGSVDAAGATMLALTGIEQAGLGATALDIVASDRNPHIAAISAWVAGRPEASLHTGFVDIGAVMRSADIAIGAAGATAWERCCLGLPTILLTIASNQRPGASALAAIPAAIWLGDPDQDTPAAVGAALKTLLAAPQLARVLATNGARLVDGLGTDRVVSAMGGADITLRAAVPDDCDPMWRWRNAPETRRHFHDPTEVSLEAHRAWFRASLGATDRRLLIGEQEGRPVGVVRFDRTGDVATVSIYLVPGLAGRGLGTDLLRAGCSAIVAVWPELAAIEADVLDKNHASRRSFLKAGFVPQYSRLRRPVNTKDTHRD